MGQALGQGGVRRGLGPRACCPPSKPLSHCSGVLTEPREEKPTQHLPLSLMLGQGLTPASATMETSAF